jgi:hypothetical protein
MLEHANMTAERRRHPRTQLQMTLSGIRLDPDGEDLLDTLHMQDISRSGMGAISSRAYYPGQRLVICLPVSDGRGRRNINAKVVRCRQLDDGYRLGLEFDMLSVIAWYANTAADTFRTLAAA